MMTTRVISDSNSSLSHLKHTMEFLSRGYTNPSCYGNRITWFYILSVMFLSIMGSLIPFPTIGPLSVYASTDVSGTWDVVFKDKDRSTLILSQSGDSVTGTISTQDGSRGEVTGHLEGQMLILSRDTGLETIQHYRMTIEGSRFTGRFYNVGKYPDEGAFNGTRRASSEPVNVAGAWEVVFKGKDHSNLFLSQSGNAVTGIISTQDGSRGEVTGHLEGQTLILSRDTGLETIQHYRVTIEGSRFTGRFYNVGKYADEGTFTGTRRYRK